MPGRVHLQPVTRRDLDTLIDERSTRMGAGEHQWFGFASTEKLRERAAKHELITADGGILAVTEDEVLAGSVEWFKSSWGRPDTSWCWSIAIGLRVDYRGRGIGRAAQRQLLDYLFEHTRAERVQAWTDRTNIAEQRALDAAGFLREGLIRRAQWRSGAWHDQVLFSALRANSTLY